MFFIKKVLILFGGNSTEHYISCISAKGIYKNIDKRLYDVKMIGIDFNGDWYLFNDDLSYLENRNWKESKITKIDNIPNYLKNFDVIFPITHGAVGEDGKLQGMLDLFDIKYVGCNTLSSAICMDKGIFKIYVDGLGLKQVPYLIIHGDYKIKDIIKKLGFPLIIKPANGGSSIGINKADNRKELIKAIKDAKKYDNKIVIEKFIKARELEVAVLQNRKELICSSPGEINSANEFYDYDAKYADEKSYTTIPDDLSDEVTHKLKEYAMGLFTNLGLKGYARIDFFYDDETGEIYINEINTIPGFTSISMYPNLMENEGISYTDLITLLINNAC